MKFRKKPVVIDAWRIDFDSFRPMWVLEAFEGEAESRVGGISWDPSGDGLWINTIEGAVVGAMGDWLIRGVMGELYPCRADIFEAAYEEVE